MPAPPPEVVARARGRYAEGVPVETIKAECGIRDSGTFYKCIDGFYDDGSGEKLLPLPRRSVVVRRVRATKAGSRASLTTRLWRTAERQVREIEQRLTVAHQEPSERERDARVLSVLVKTLRELAAFDADAPDDKKRAETKDVNDDLPRDVDELRRELSRRLDAMAAGHAD